MAERSNLNAPLPAMFLFNNDLLACVLAALVLRHVNHSSLKIGSILIM